MRYAKQPVKFRTASSDYGTDGTPLDTLYCPSLIEGSYTGWAKLVTQIAIQINNRIKSGRQTHHGW
ncbi:hypothetical protein UNDYM_0057 [Undibacterium sp. YM2]|nr:hypothetical protein UNDYM_0057 [Undibacterium sp. YM2]